MSDLGLDPLSAAISQSDDSSFGLNPTTVKPIGPAQAPNTPSPVQGPAPAPAPQATPPIADPLAKLNATEPGRYRAMSPDDYAAFQKQQQQKQDQPQGFIAGFEQAIGQGNLRGAGYAAKGISQLVGSPDLYDAANKMIATSDSIAPGGKAPTLEGIAHAGSAGAVASQAWNYLKYQLGSALGGAAAPVAGAAVGGIAAGAVAGPEAAPAGALAGLVGPTAIPAYGDVYDQLVNSPGVAAQVKAGKISPKELAAIPIAPAAVMTAIYSTGLEAALGKAVVGKIAGSITKRLVQGAATGSLFLGGASGIQEAIKQGVSDAMGDDTPMSQRVQAVVDSTVGGALGGAAFGVASHISGGHAEPAAESEPDQEEQQQPTQPAAPQPAAPQPAPGYKPGTTVRVTAPGTANHGRDATVMKPVGGGYSVLYPDGTEGFVDRLAVRPAPLPGEAAPQPAATPMPAAVEPTPKPSSGPIGRALDAGEATQAAQAAHDALPPGSRVAIGMPGTPDMEVTVAGYHADGMDVVDASGDQHTLPMDDPEIKITPIAKAPAAQVATTPTPTLPRAPEAPAASTIPEAPKPIEAPAKPAEPPAEKPVASTAPGPQIKPAAGPAPKAPTAAPRNVPINANIGGTNVAFPDQAHALLFSLGQRRQTFRANGRNVADTDALMLGERQKAAADLHMPISAVNQAADDYRYQVETGAKKATGNQYQAPAIQAGVDANPIWDSMPIAQRADIFKRAGVSWNPKMPWSVLSEPIRTKVAPIIDGITNDEKANAAATSPANDREEPTQPQKEAGNYKLGHLKVGPLDVSIENPEGSTRNGVGEDGKPWSSDMYDHYGYVRGTVGIDKDHVDVFVKKGTPETWGGKAYVVDQNKPDGSFDEHKAMIGYSSAEEARKAYLRNYKNDQAKNIRGVTEMPIDKFDAWAKSDEPKKGPLSKEAAAEPTAAPAERESLVGQQPEPQGQSTDRPQAGAKWFGSRDKADRYVEKNKLGDTHEVVKAGRRFEVREKEQNPGRNADKGTKPIGVNSKGQQLHEDARGVRSIVENGIRHTEPVGMRPKRGGGTDISTDREAHPEYQTADEAAAKADAGARHTVETSFGKVPVDNRYDVASYANSAAGDDHAPVVVDHSIPEYSPTLKGKDGKPAHLWRYVAEHEVQERKAMRDATAQFKEQHGRDPNEAELKAIYEDKHINVATPAERKLVEADGIDWDQYTRTVNGYVKHLQEREHPNPAPFPFHVDAELANKHTNEVPETVKDVTGEENAKPVEGATPAEPAAEAKPTGVGYGAKNKLVTAARADEIRAKLKAKFKGQLNAGIDPEILSMGTELAAFHIEAGARKFADVARAIAGDLGTPVATIRKFLRAWYNGARDLLEDSGHDVTGMDTPETVRAQAPVLGDAESDNEPAKLGQSGEGPLEGVSPETVREPGSERKTGSGATERGGDDVSGHDRAGKPRVQVPRGVGDGEGAVSVRSGGRKEAGAGRSELDREADQQHGGWDPLESTCRHASLSIL